MSDPSEKLLIPVNPNYQWDHEPGLQADYVNPVVLNNKVIYYANAYITVTQRLGDVLRELVEAKRDIEENETRLADFEHSVLAEIPPPNPDRQSTRLIDAYILRVLDARGEHQFTSLKTALRAAKTRVATLNIKAEYYRAQQHAIQLAGEHIQTHLSFVKNEKRQSKSYT